MLAHLFHLSSVMGCLADDRMPPITGIGPRDQQLIPDEIVLEDWGRGTVVVDGSAVATSTRTYRGLDFAMGADLERHPFVLLRLAGGSPEWPPLCTTVMPDEGLTM